MVFGKLVIGGMLVCVLIFSSVHADDTSILGATTIIFTPTILKDTKGQFMTFGNVDKNGSEISGVLINNDPKIPSLGSKSSTGEIKVESYKSDISSGELIVSIPNFQNYYFGVAVVGLPDVSPLQFNDFWVDYGLMETIKVPILKWVIDKHLEEVALFDDKNKVFYCMDSWTLSKEICFQDTGLWEETGKTNDYNKIVWGKTRFEVQDNFAYIKIHGDWNASLGNKIVDVLINYFDWKTEFAWFNSNWNYKKTLTITNNDVNTLKQNVVRFNVNTQALVSTGKMLNTCNDARFYNNFTSQLLDYNVSGCNTADTNFYFKYDLIGGQVDTNTDFYYGNSSATQLLTANGICQEISGGSCYFFSDNFDSYSNTTDLENGKWHRYGTGGTSYIFPSSGGNNLTITTVPASAETWVTDFNYTLPYRITADVNIVRLGTGGGDVGTGFSTGILTGTGQNALGSDKWLWTTVDAGGRYTLNPAFGSGVDLTPKDVNTSKWTNYIFDVNFSGMRLDFNWNGNLLFLNTPIVDWNSPINLYEFKLGGATTNLVSTAFDNIKLEQIYFSSTSAGDEVRYSFVDANLLTFSGNQYYNGIQGANSDKNYSIDFNVSSQGIDNYLRASLFYSSVKGSFQNKIIDLNLFLMGQTTNSDYNCTGNDFNANTRTCHADFNILTISGDGNYFIDLNVRNTTDNNKASFSVTAWVKDTNKPTTRWDGNSTWQKTDANIHLYCTDSYCNVIQYKINSGSWLNFDANVLFSSDGNISLEFDANDLSSNLSDVNQKYVLIDKSAPILSGATAGGITNNNRPTFQVTVTDSLSGANNCDLNYYKRVSGTTGWVLLYANQVVSIAGGVCAFAPVLALDVNDSAFVQFKGRDNLSNLSSDTNTGFLTYKLAESSPPSGGGGGTTITTVQRGTYEILEPTSDLSFNAYKGFRGQVLFSIKNKTDDDLFIQFLPSAGIEKYLLLPDDTKISKLATRNFVLSLVIPTDEVATVVSGTLTVTDGVSPTNYVVSFDVGSVPSQVIFLNWLNQKTFSIPNVVIVLVSVLSVLYFLVGRK